MENGFIIKQTELCFVKNALDITIVMDTTKTGIGKFPEMRI